MIKISFSKQRLRGVNWYEVTATGHASYAPQGQDIVCAAVSILLTTLAEMISQFHESNNALLDEADLRSGKAHLRFALESAGEEAVETTVTGLKLIAASYPENCELKLSGVG